MSDAPKVVKNVRFGKLVVIRGPLAKRIRGALAYLCRCDCGNTRIVTGIRLRRRDIKMCNPCAVARGAVKTAAKKTTHGQTESRTYSRWQSMLDRCRGNRPDLIRLYRDRGITVCRRWRESFVEFLKDMGTCPPGLTLERIDNDGSYRPGNCKWATRKQQAQNTRTNKRVTFNGETHIISEWARKLGVQPTIITYRINRAGYPPWFAVVCPVGLTSRNRQALMDKLRAKA
jgi:hypothetical protein